MDQMNVSIIILTFVNYVIRMIPDIASINDQKIIIYFIVCLFLLGKFCAFQALPKECKAVAVPIILLLCLGLVSSCDCILHHCCCQ